MTNSSLNTGRSKQKQLTRQNILRTTQKLLEQQTPLTLEEVAQAAGISRATIYRYFSNIDVLYSEASLDLVTHSTASIFKDIEHLSVVDRILHIQSYFNKLALRNEMAFRTYLSIYLKESETAKSTRGSRRTAALKLAIQPYRHQIPKKDYQKLITVATALMGIEPFVVGKDVCGLTSEETEKHLNWGLKTILETVFKP
ncbi:TetR/AcrR family transcriptional regulator [Cognatitamlana onchidii]|uniref:TetR/AcrR family transcriptional regulator n=1 Tax=Cognatitamlana onchidii TaxID=2562860 RepID=UPI0010A5F852|nr:TetR/AcrR family transcriptional regulator [Algibacter onchidii]